MGDRRRRLGRAPRPSSTTRISSSSACSSTTRTRSGRTPARSSADRRPGVFATDDKDADPRPRGRPRSPRGEQGLPRNTNTDDIVALLESGKDVITTTSYNHLPTYGTEVDARIEAACARAGTRFHAAGEHPGFMFERLATAITALSQRVDRITVQEVVDCRGVGAKEMLVDLMGMGRQPEEISTDSAMFRAVSVQYEQALAAAADVLALRVDEIHHSIRTATARHDIVLAPPRCPQAASSDRSSRGARCTTGEPVLVAEEHWTVTDIPEWDLTLDGEFLVRVRVEGVPSLSLDLRIGNERVAGLPGVAGGQLAVAMTAIRAIPDVRRAPPGVVIPHIFGAYRWPER